MRKRTLATLVLGCSIPLLAQQSADNKPLFPPAPRVVDPYPSCGAAFHEKYVKRLSGKQQQYLQRTTDIMYSKSDLDGEGTEDTIDIQSRSAVEPCNMDYEWYEKKNTIMIRYDADHSWQQEFIGDLVAGMNLYPGKQQIQVVMKNIDGAERKITFHYELPEGRK